MFADLKLPNLQLSWPVTVLAIVAALILRSTWLRFKRNPRQLPYPPGPPRRFLLGNLADIPTKGYEWLAYAKLAEKYGDVMYFKAIGKSILSINSYAVANDLLEKKGAIYSDRPRLPMLKEVIGWTWNLVVQSYSEGFAVHRRIVQQRFQAHIVAKEYRPIMALEVRILLFNLHNRPDAFLRHVKRMAAAVIMMISYGHRVTSDQDEYVRLAEKVRETASGAPGSVLVDFMPILKYIPSWFPGAGFKRKAMVVRQLSAAMRDRPYAEIQARLNAGTAIPSLVSSLIEENMSGENVIDEQVIKNVGGVIYAAGADTTVTALTNFFLAMALHPAVQERAQEELDRVVGSKRLPEFADRSDLPFVSAVVKETLRWKPVTPLGVVHCLTEDDEYRGTYIPKRTVVVPNIAAMLHDENDYTRPADFDPVRFLSVDGTSPAPDPARAAFGFGRRVCPGRFFADDQLFITIASVLQVFNIIRPVDASGHPVELKVDWASGIVAFRNITIKALRNFRTSQGEMGVTIEAQDQSGRLPSHADLFKALWIILTCKSIQKIKFSLIEGLPGGTFHSKVEDTSLAW
ncbi:hypothetical protein EIP91_007967 [Steccherinum ochraceum]|uniref:Cytochrome P450 n=1 Tax=Steccherinum ochraceum TaxID=92696 RepID=A0A4R0R993_9APHY|nr:hypothetical protein EIP91_007967 [Steccherinum ochraceum]